MADLSESLCLIWLKLLISNIVTYLEKRYKMRYNQLSLRLQEMFF
jgi:hypothetical protein